MNTVYSLPIETPNFDGQIYGSTFAGTGAEGVSQQESTHQCGSYDSIVGLVRPLLAILAMFEALWR